MVLVAVLLAWTAVAFAVGVRLGRWIERHAPTPPEE